MRLCLVVLGLACLTHVCSSELKRVCYFTNWAQYRAEPMNYFPEDVDAFLCTHVIYSFADMDGNRLTTSEWNDEDLYARLMLKKEENPDLKVLLAVGGWEFNLTKMSDMLETEENRQEFVTTSITFLRAHSFDGLDLDFEYPGSRGSPPEDKFLYTSLVQELRAAFNEEGVSTSQDTLLLTAAVPCGESTINEGYEIELISPELDWVGLMAYDLSGSWDSITGLHAPLRIDIPNAPPGYDKRCVDWCVTRWLQGGSTRSKLVVGLPLYGLGFTLDDPAVHALYSAAKLVSEDPPSYGSDPGNYTAALGMMSYYEVCDMFLAEGSPVIRPPGYDMPYTHLGDQWISYDDLESITAKVLYICDNDYAGYMAWSMDFDDFNSLMCGGIVNPLLTTMRDVIQTCQPTTTAAAATTTTTTTSTTSENSAPSRGSPMTSLTLLFWVILHANHRLS